MPCRGNSILENVSEGTRPGPSGVSNSETVDPKVADPKVADEQGADRRDGDDLPRWRGERMGLP